MLPYFKGILLLVALKRTCPRCHKPQIVSQANLKKSVICKNCGAEIPPKRIR